MERRLDLFLANFVSIVWDIHMVASKLEFDILKTVLSPLYFFRDSSCNFIDVDIMTNHINLYVI